MSSSSSSPLRSSRVLSRLRTDSVASCVKMNLSDARAIEIAAMCGFDCVWLDLEHVPNTLQHIEHGIRAAKAYNCDTLVRVPRGSYSDLVRPLEMDAAGIMIPHVMSADDARRIVWQTKFHPLGRRPVDGGNSDGAYCSVSLTDYMAHANAQRFVALQIEDPEPLDELNEIAALPGVDMLFFGPGDFTQGIGCPGQFDHPKVDEARRAVADAAVRHGKVAGTVASLQSLQSTIEAGYRFISVGADVVGLRDYFAQIAAAFNAAPMTQRAGVYRA